jgi:hypothetical protein
LDPGILVFGIWTRNLVSRPRCLALNRPHTGGKIIDKLVRVFQNSATYQLTWEEWRVMWRVRLTS